MASPIFIRRCPLAASFGWDFAVEQVEIDPLLSADRRSDEIDDQADT
jgi:hypothetical protein